jgi:hypothetical protein
MGVSRGFWAMCIIISFSGVAPEEGLFHGVSELVFTYSGKANEAYTTTNALREYVQSSVVHVDPRCTMFFLCTPDMGTEKPQNESLSNR